MSNNIKHNLHNTHSSNRLLHWLKGHPKLAVKYCKMMRDCVCQILAQEVRGEGGGVWALLCHTNTMLKEFKVYKTQKFLLQYCHAIYMLTRLRQQCQVLQQFPCPVWQWKGSGHVHEESCTPLPALAFPGKVTKVFNPSGLHCGGGAEQDPPSARIHNQKTLQSFSFNCLCCNILPRCYITFY